MHTARRADTRCAPLPATTPPPLRNGRAAISPPTGVQQPEADFDLVENAFAESFPTAPDPTSFLRLAGVPFVGRSADGTFLHLLRVEYEQMTDVATATPHLGGGSMRIDPLPVSMVSRRRLLRFAYQGQDGLVRLSLAEARDLQAVVAEDVTPHT